MYGFGAIAAQQGEVVNLASGTCFNDETRVGTKAFSNQVLMDRRGCEQCWNRDMIAIDISISQNQHGIAAFNRIDCPRAQSCETRFDTVRTPSSGVADVEFEAAEFVARQLGDAANPSHLFVVENGLVDFETEWRVDVVDI